jgi:hypothetical protein
MVIIGNEIVNLNDLAGKDFQPDQEVVIQREKRRWHMGILVEEGEWELKEENAK